MWGRRPVTEYHSKPFVRHDHFDIVGKSERFVKGLKAGCPYGLVTLYKGGVAVKKIPMAILTPELLREEDADQIEVENSYLDKIGLMIYHRVCPYTLDLTGWRGGWEKGGSSPITKEEVKEIKYLPIHF